MPTFEIIEGASLPAAPENKSMATSTSCTLDHDQPSMPQGEDEALTQEPGANQPNGDIVSAVMSLVNELRAQNQDLNMEHHRSRLQNRESIALTTELESTEVWTRFWNTCVHKGEDIAVYGLLKAVEEVPDFWLQPDKGTGATVLHFAVHFGYHELVEKVLEKLKVKAEEGNTRNSRILSRATALDCFHQTGTIDRLSAVKISGMYGHPKILKCFFALPSYFLPGITMAEGFELEIEHGVWLKQEEFHDKWVYSQSIREMPWFQRFENWVEERGSKNFTTALHWGVQELSEEDLENFVRILCETNDPEQELPQFLTFRDRRGRTPLHVAVEEKTKCDFKQIVDILERYFPTSFDLNVTDFVRKTPLHWAAVFGYYKKVAVLVQAPSINLNATCKSKIEETFISVGTKPGNWHKHFLVPVDGVTALHLAAFYNHYKVVEILLSAAAEDQGNNSPRVSVNALCQQWIPLNIRDSMPAICGLRWRLTAFQLAAVKGHVQTLQAFLKSDKIYDYGFAPGINKVVNMPVNNNCIPALHIAAVACHPFAVKVLLDSHKVNACSVDKDGYTALHYVTRYGGEVAEFTNAVHGLHGSVCRELMRSTSIKTSAANVIGCVELLLQRGLDMDIKSNTCEIPTLHPYMDEKVAEWWFTKLARGMEEERASLRMVANAISFTAALVATASFVGPLQPPLGVLTDSNPTWVHGYSQVNHVFVHNFLLTDSLSFYFAIASILLAMFPSLPIPHESLLYEVKLARKAVQCSIGFLNSSIAFVIQAFFFATVAILPGRTWTIWGMNLVGCILCLFVQYLSTIRFMRVFKRDKTSAGMLNKIFRMDNV